MILNAVLAVALGLTPMQAGQGIQTVSVNSGDYDGLIGRYDQSVDRSGMTRLTGFDRLTGHPFDITVARDGRVEGTVGETYVTFRMSPSA